MSGLKPYDKKKIVCVNLHREITKMIKFMGGTIVNKSSLDVQSQTYLIAPAPVRNINYIYHIAAKRPTVHYFWIINSYLKVPVRLHYLTFKREENLIQKDTYYRMDIRLITQR